MTTTTLPLPEMINPVAQARSDARRKGKIARLPKATRDMINHMLDDGLPYPVIIDEIGEAGEGLNAQNLTNWKNGGYQDYLKVQETIDKLKAQTETAIDILRDLEHEKILGGIPLGNFFDGSDRDFLVAVTELSSREQLDHFASALSAAISRERR